MKKGMRPWKKVTNMKTVTKMMKVTKKKKNNSDE
jgi:hypothetical protein